MKKNVLFPVCIFLFFLGLLFFGEMTRDAAAEGLHLCITVLIPSLFPFSAGVNFLLKVGFAEKVEKSLGKPFQRLFGLPCSAVFPALVGFLGGFPLGAQCLAELYTDKKITKNDAVELSAVCNQAGPAFILGALGGGILHDPLLGAGLLGIQFLSALLTALLFCHGTGDTACPEKRSVQPIPFEKALTQAIGDSTLSMLRMTGIVVFFSVVIALLNSYLPYHLLTEIYRWILAGLLEVSSGTAAFSGQEQETVFPVIALLVGWGGFCVHLQAADAFIQAGLPMRKYLYGKAYQSILSFAMAWVFVPILLGRPDPLRVFLSGLLLLLTFIMIICRILKNKIGIQNNLCYNRKEKTI